MSSLIFQKKKNQCLLALEKRELLFLKSRTLRRERLGAYSHEGTGVPTFLCEVLTAVPKVNIPMALTNLSEWGDESTALDKLPNSEIDLENKRVKRESGERKKENKYRCSKKMRLDG